MENLASLVLDNKKAIQRSECHRRHGEEIEGSHYLVVILEKGEPRLTGIPTPNYTTQISGHRALREGKASFCSSACILGAPHSGLSRARRLIKSLSCWVILGLPPRGR